MSVVGIGGRSALFGNPRHTSVSRGITEFRCGRPIVICGEGQTYLVLPVDSLDPERLAEFTALCAPSVPDLIITARRAVALGLDAATPISLPISADDDVQAILSFATDPTIDRVWKMKPAGFAAAAAIQLAKLAHGLPAVLAAKNYREISIEPSIMKVDASAIAGFMEDVTGSLTIASEASVPLNSNINTRFVVFNDAMGGSSVAIIVGTPDFTKPVPVRLHSACLTGDVFGSRRCDCGDQLRLAIPQLKALGGGIILYLAQEGRGVGLANKMRTYQLQDHGFDTVDANTVLGFDDDERDYGIAARMLHLLDCTRIVLLTNNPSKLDGLAKAGITITSRISIETPINADNRRYMTTKATRAGHRIDQVIAALSEP